MRKRTTAIVAVAVIGLTGCGGIGLPAPSAPDPTISYPIVPSEDITKEACTAVVAEVNDLSRTLAQFYEALEGGDLLLAASLLNALQSQLSDIGGDAKGDPELEVLLSDLQGAAESLNASIAEIDTSDPLAATEGIQEDAEALRAAIDGLLAYCTA
ncbi:MAG TPA: hypothetical protein H9830_03450 [Candidatus Agrococcus pullicola]|uniref:Lipoprotein n=1 Tax=Candidatus Agrococcus pullicola TaxID=2838429 RepID=A0A9D1YT40_9MICO|nr:hypothetical protein [Candidatus Agrococcus pullicola]